MVSTGMTVSAIKDTGEPSVKRRSTMKKVGRYGSHNFKMLYLAGVQLQLLLEADSYEAS